MVIPSLHLGYIEDDKKETAIAIEQFHQRMAAGNFDQIYADAHPALQRSQSRETLIGAMEQTRDTWGELRQVTRSEVKVVMGAPIQIRAVYNATFEKGDATELFIFVRQGEKVQLANYQVLPGTLKTNTEEIEAAKRAAEEFYRQMAAGQYDSIFDAADEDFKRSTTREAVRTTLQQVKERMGPCESPTLVDGEYANQDGGHFVGLIYSRRCAHGELHERLAWRVVDGRAFLRGYH